MRLTKTQKAILEHARKIGLVTVVGSRQELAAHKLLLAGLIKHIGGPWATFTLTETGRNILNEKEA